MLGSKKEIMFLPAVADLSIKRSAVAFIMPGICSGINSMS